MGKPILSIIIPVYKVEKFLERCLDSVLDQDTEGSEIILVDDGSPDNCGKICDRYSGEYVNVTSLHKQNGGLSDARNFGLNHCQGEYVWFIDSDDYVSKGCIKEIISILKEIKCDVFVCQSKIVNDKGNCQDEKNYSINAGLYTSQEYMKILKKHPKSVLFCAQYHICRYSFLTKNNIFFFKGIIHEDELWTPQLLINADKIYYSGMNIYYHYMRAGSIMNSGNYEKSGSSDIIVTQELLRIFDESQRKDLIYLRDHMVDTYLQAVWKVPEQIINKKMKDRSMPLKNSYYLKTRLKALLYFISPMMYLKLHSMANLS